MKKPEDRKEITNADKPTEPVKWGQVISGLVSLGLVIYVIYVLMSK